MATTTDQRPEMGLQKVTGTGGVITTPAEYERSVQVWLDEKAHVLCPAVSFSGLPAQHALVASKIKLNPDPAGGDVYQDNIFIKGREVAIAKIGLSKIAQCAGISVDTKRMDDRSVPFLWEIKATATWIGFDGTPQSCNGTVEYDLRDGSPRLKGFTANQIEQARKHGLAGAETRAINRAIRQFGIKQKYTQEELAKPFVVVRVTFQPDMSDPVQRAVVTQQRLAGTSAMYAQALPPAAPPEPIDGEVVSSTPAPVKATPAATSSTPATSTASSADFDELPPAEGTATKTEPDPRYTITRVGKQTQPDGSAKYFVSTDRTLDSLLEASETIALAAAAAKRDGSLVELTLERTDKGVTVLELRPVKAAPAAELPSDARFVSDVTDKSGQTNGREWTRYTVMFKDGAEATTFSLSLARVASEAKQRGLPVRAAFSTNEKYPDQQNLESLDIIDTRQGTLPMSAEL